MEKWFSLNKNFIFQPIQKIQIAADAAFFAAFYGIFFEKWKSI